MTPDKANVLRVGITYSIDQVRAVIAEKYPFNDDLTDDDISMISHQLEDVFDYDSWRDTLHDEIQIATREYLLNKP